MCIKSTGITISCYIILRGLGPTKITHFASICSALLALLRSALASSLKTCTRPKSESRSPKRKALATSSRLPGDREARARGPRPGPGCMGGEPCRGLLARA